jgi:hypothetical protein
MRRVLGAAIGTAVGLLFLTAPASAQFLTFVSAAGNDANTCFVQAAPCKTLQRAINQTSPGGEVRLLTSLANGGSITKSLTVEGGYNTIIGTITVNNASAIVRFRRLNLNGRDAFTDGFNLINAAAVHIEECSAERYGEKGIGLGNGVATELVVSNSVLRDNAFGIAVAASTAKLMVEHSSFANNAIGILMEGGQGSIVRSSFSGNATGLSVADGTVNASGVIAASNSDAGFVVDSGEQLTLMSCDAHGNVNLGLSILGTARISDCVFTGSNTGVDGSGTALTRENNLIAGNDDDVDIMLTPLAGE